MKCVYDKNGKQVGFSFERTQLKRPQFTKAERIEKLGKTKNGMYKDPNTKTYHKLNEVDLGHKAGYEFKSMKNVAQRVGMSQEDFNKMMKNAKNYQAEYYKNNRSHKYECKDSKVQRKNAFSMIREYYNKKAENLSKQKDSKLSNIRVTTKDFNNTRNAKQGKVQIKSAKQSKGSYKGSRGQMKTVAVKQGKGSGKSTGASRSTAKTGSMSHGAAKSGGMSHGK